MNVKVTYWMKAGLFSSGEEFLRRGGVRTVGMNGERERDRDLCLRYGGECDLERSLDGDLTSKSLYGNRAITKDDENTLKIFVVCVEEIGSWIETEIWNRTYYVIDYVNMTFKKEMKKM